MNIQTNEVELMRNILRVLWISLLEAVVIIITLISVVQMKLPILGIYFIYGITVIIIPLIFLLVYKRFLGRETLVIVPISLILAALYSLGISLYSYYGTSSFSRMFDELMYYIYFLPSMIYCGMGWVEFALIVRMTRDQRRT
jgi:hypothetical protein